MTVTKRAVKADILLLLTAAIWGFGFVAQRSGMEFVGPFAFNGVRFILGSISLLPLIFYRYKRKTSADAHHHETPQQSLKQLCKPVFAAGLVLFFAVMLQQIGIMFTTAGNAGFITGLYVVLTPIFAVSLGRKTGIATWIGCILTFIGLYLISVQSNYSSLGKLSINPGDVFVIVSAFFWAVHVLLIDRFMQPKENSGKIDPIELSSGQFAVVGILSVLGAIIIEPHIGGIVEKINPSLLNQGLFSWSLFPSVPVQAFIPILYGGLASVGIAYTLQVVAQRDAPPAHAVIILCFEGCFAVLGGMLLLGEKAGGWTLLGCALMLAGMLATQWEVVAKGLRD